MRQFPFFWRKLLIATESSLVAENAAAETCGHVLMPQKRRLQTPQFAIDRATFICSTAIWLAHASPGEKDHRQRACFRRMISCTACRIGYRHTHIQQQYTHLVQICLNGTHALPARRHIQTFNKNAQAWVTAMSSPADRYHHYGLN